MKNVLLEETPWVGDALQETEQMQLLASMSEGNELVRNIDQDFQNLKDYQNQDGGFSWCNGNRSSIYVTLYVMNQLRKLAVKGINLAQVNNILQQIMPQANLFIEEQMKRMYRNDQRNGKGLLVHGIHFEFLQYQWFVEQYWNQKFISDIATFYLNNAYKHWVDLPLSRQVDLGIIAHNREDHERAQ